VQCEDFKRNYPEYESDLTSRLTQAGVLHDVGEVRATASDANMALEVRLGKLVEKMRDNCDANLTMLSSLTEMLEASGFPCSTPARVSLGQLHSSTFGQRSGRFNRRARRSVTRERHPSSDSTDGALGSHSASFLESSASTASNSGQGGQGDQDARESQEWLSFQLARSLEQIASLQTQVAELRVRTALQKGERRDAPTSGGTYRHMPRDAPVSGSTQRDHNELDFFQDKEGQNYMDSLTASRLSSARSSFDSTRTLPP